MTCKRLEKYYVIYGIERVCGLRWDLHRREVLVCGPERHRETMEHVATFFGPIRIETATAVNKSRFVVELKKPSEWSEGLDHLRRFYDLEMTGSFRRLCR